jgi:hypothetical protein
MVAALGAQSKRIIAANPPEEIFTDRSKEAGIDFVHFNSMSGEHYYPEILGSGGALFDYDNDGDLDIFLVQGSVLGLEKKSGEALPVPCRVPGTPLLVEWTPERRVKERRPSVSARSTAPGNIDLARPVRLG